MREARLRSDISETDRKRLGRIFGRLTLRYTRARVYSEYEGHTKVEPYKVVAKDHESVVVVAGKAESHSVQHIHFDGDRYWTHSPAGFREFFKRVA